MHPPPSSLHAANPPDMERLLSIVRELARELRPGANDMKRLTLDHALERDFGLDSLARVELLVRIERELGIKLAEAAFAEAETPRDLLRQMAGERTLEHPLQPKHQQWQKPESSNRREPSPP